MISKDEWKEICYSLMDHHSLFYKLGEMGKPILTESIPTACVTFDKKGNYFNFLFNPKLWNESTFYEKMFIVCHEALHIILNHGKRFKDSTNPQLSNIAIDIVVNHALVNRFGFVRENINKHEDLCWIDTIFKGKKINGINISEDENAEYYLNLMNKNIKKINSNVSLVDSHNFDEFDSEVFDILDKELTDEEKQGLKKFFDKHDDKNNQAGSVMGGKVHYAQGSKIQVKRKWETVIDRWARKIINNRDTNVDQWAKQHRRFVMLNEKLFLPSESEIEDLTFDNRKCNVYFYLDTSGSCWNLKDRFFAAAESLPKKFFEVKLFCFDTVVYNTDSASKKISGGGGTKFNILEENIQKLIESDKESYPDAVFIITDLYGNAVNPQKPERWHWFVDGPSKSVFQNLKSEYLPPECKVYSLNDFI
jgi:predicted metal-dependent peptidase